MAQMTQMTGYIGSIPVVQLLRDKGTYRMTPESRTVGLNQTYRSTRSDRGHTGIPTPTSTQVGGSTWPDLDQRKWDRGRNSAGRKYWRPSWPMS
jgi:hypothetical protein